MKKEIQDSDPEASGEMRTHSSVNRRTFTPRLIIQLLVFIVLIPLLPILISGRWNWWEAWVYALICFIGFVVSRIITARVNPDLINERARSMDLEGAKSWDKVIAPLVSLGGGLVPLIADLDELLSWSPGFVRFLKVIALILIITGYVLSSYAMVVNRFFSGVVRIQHERNHTVVNKGPYRVVRHPGYSGAIITYLATPVFLDSAWALLPALMLTVMLIVRTSMEDNTLKNELDGYADFANKVRYRLIPGLW